VGFVGGSFVPVAGNAAGLVGGATLGSAGGALLGGSAGGALGAIAGGVICSSAAAPGGGGGGTNGSTGDSTGRSTPKNLKEQLALDSAKSNPGAGTPVPLKKGMTDARWPGREGWQKMAQSVDGVEIHYVWNRVTGAVADFKFK
jgi:hypothetical protein